MPGGQNEQDVAPWGAHEPAVQEIHEGGEFQYQLLSTADLKSVDLGPAEPAAQEKRYEEAPTIGGDMGARFEPGKVAAEGCDSEMISGNDNERL